MSVVVKRVEVDLCLELMEFGDGMKGVQEIETLLFVCECLKSNHACIWVLSLRFWFEFTPKSS